jgi:hypothetical protein
MAKFPPWVSKGTYTTSKNGSIDTELELLKKCEQE